MYALFFHAPLNIFFVTVCGFGYLGVAMATAMFQRIHPCHVYLFVWYRVENGYWCAKSIGMNQSHVRTDLIDAMNSFYGTQTYLSLALLARYHYCIRKVGIRNIHLYGWMVASQSKLCS